MHLFHCWVPDGADGVEGIDWCIVLPLRFRSFVCLFEQMLILVGCMEFVWFLYGECIFSGGEVGMFSYAGPCRLHIPCSWQGDHRHRWHIVLHFIFLSVSFICNVVTGEFDTSVWGGRNFVCVHIVGSLHIEQYPFYVRHFEFYFTLFYVLYVEYVLFLGRF
jgi:hypothetical protein